MSARPPRPRGERGASERAAGARVEVPTLSSLGFPRGYVFSFRLGDALMCVGPRRKGGDASDAGSATTSELVCERRDAHSTLALG